MKNKTALKSEKQGFGGRYFLVLLWYAAIALIEWAMIDIFVNAGFDWRNPCMEYTEKGRQITSILLMLPLFLLLTTVWIRFSSLYHQHKPVRFFLIEIAVCFLGVCFSFALCFVFISFGLLPEWLMEVRRCLMGVIKGSDWMCWPAP